MDIQVHGFHEAGSAIDVRLQLSLRSLPVPGDGQPGDQKKNDIEVDIATRKLVIGFSCPVL